MRYRRLSLASLVVGVLAAIASAQPAAPEKKQPTREELDRAREYFKAAEAAKKRGDYQAAIENYLAAYKLFQEPEFFFNVGEVCRLAGDEARALSYFQKYLDLEPNGRGAAAAHAAVDQLQRAIAAKSAPLPSVEAETDRKADEITKPEAQTAKPGGDVPVGSKATNDEAKPNARRVQPFPTPPSPARTADIPVLPRGDQHQSKLIPTEPQAAATPTVWHWYDDQLGDSIAIGGVVVAALGLIEYGRARGEIGSAEEASTYPDTKRLVDSAHQKATISIGLAIGGGALVIAGTLHILHDSHLSERSVSVVPANRGGMITYEATF